MAEYTKKTAIGLVAPASAVSASDMSAYIDPGVVASGHSAEEGNEH